MLLCCSLPKFGKVPKGQSNILHPKMSQIVRNFCHKFSATFGFFERNFLGGLIIWWCNAFWTALYVIIINSLIKQQACHVCNQQGCKFSRNLVLAGYFRKFSLIVNITNNLRTSVDRNEIIHATPMNTITKSMF